MRYPRDKRTILFFVSTVVIGVLVFSLFIFFFVSNAPGLLRTRQSIGRFFSPLTSIFSSKYNLEKENIALKERITELNLALLDRDILSRENETLKGMIGRSDTRSRILAAVIATPNQSPYDTLIIDGGARAHISVDKLVYVGSTPIGRIKKVEDTIAHVVLFSTAGEETQVYIEGINLHTAIIGRGGGTFEVTLPDGVTILSGTSFMYPGLTAGIVAVAKEIISKSDEPAQHILLESPVSIHALHFVEVEK